MNDYNHTKSLGHASYLYPLEYTYISLTITNVTRQQNGYIVISATSGHLPLGPSLGWKLYCARRWVVRRLAGKGLAFSVGDPRGNHSSWAVEPRCQLHEWGHHTRSSLFHMWV